jgi:hypothetical protein
MTINKRGLLKAASVKPDHSIRKHSSKKYSEAYMTLYAYAYIIIIMAINISKLLSAAPMAATRLICLWLISSASYAVVKANVLAWRPA